MSAKGACGIFFASDGSSIDFDPATGLYNIRKGNGTVLFSVDTSGNAIIPGAISKIGGLSLAGKSGVPLIVSAPAVGAGKTGAVTNFINYTPPAVAGVYRVLAEINVTAWTTPASFTVAITYADSAGNARTDTAALSRGSNGGNAAAITAVDRWFVAGEIIAIDNSATAITLSTTGTFSGTPTYTITAILEQVI